MDLRNDIVFDTDYSLNDAAVEDGRISGNQINNLNISPVGVVGFTEKTALAEGVDASDVYDAARTIKIVGQTLGATFADTYDRFQELLFRLSPAEEFLDHADVEGFLPLAGYVPTLVNSFTEYPASSGKYRVPLVIFCRSKAPPAFDLSRDRVGGKGDRGFSIPWQVVLEAKDPRVYINDQQIVAFTGTSGAGTFTNRGKYRTPLTVILDVKANQTASMFVLTMHDTTMTITIPHDAATQSLWYDGPNKLLYRKIGTGAWLKAGSLLSIDNPAEALPAHKAYSWTLDHDVLATLGSIISFYEAWA